MAYYEDRQHRRPRDRHGRGYAKDYYYGEDPYENRAHEVMRRRAGSDDSLEEVHREYPKSDYGYEYGYGLPPSRHSRVSSVQEGGRRSHSTRDRDPYYEDSDYSRPRHSRRSKHYDDRRYRHRHSSRSPSSSRSPPPPRRRKSFSEQALGALGLGAAASSTSRHRDHSRGRSNRYRSSSYSPSRSRSRPRRDKSEQRIAQAVKAAVTAGAVEAFRSRKDPGDWTGAKGKRILTAAITAGGTDGLVDRDPNKHSKRHVIESTLAGLAANHFMNGSHSRSRSRHRGRSKSRGGLGDLAASGALAAAGKEAYDRFRSKSRHRGRSSSRESYDESPPRREKKRSKSVTDYINRGLGALGLDDKKDSDDRRDHHHRRSRPSHYSDYSDDDDYDSGYRSRRHGSPRRSRHSRDPRDVDVGRPSYPSDFRRPRAASTTAMTAPQRNGGHHNYENRHHEDCKTEGQDSDPGNSTDEEKQKKKLTRQTLMATGLATVASIHAAHSVHSSMEQHHKRMELVKEGEMSPEEARRRRIKGNIVDAASIGLAAMGINGALEEWKHVNEKRKERTSFTKSCSEKRNQRHLRTQSQGPSRSSRQTYRLPDEIEEYPNEPTRSRSVVHEQPRYA